MITMSDAEYVTTAIAALAECKTDATLVEWDDRYTNNEGYLHLPDKLLRQLETAYDKRLREIAGGDEK